MAGEYRTFVIQATQDTIRNRYGLHQNFVYNPQAWAKIAKHMYMIIMSVCKSNFVVSTHHIAYPYVYHVLEYWCKYCSAYEEVNEVVIISLPVKI